MIILIHLTQSRRDAGAQRGKICLLSLHLSVPGGCEKIRDLKSFERFFLQIEKVKISYTLESR